MMRRQSGRLARAVKAAMRGRTRHLAVTLALGLAVTGTLVPRLDDGREHDSVDLLAQLVAGDGGHGDEGLATACERSQIAVRTSVERVIARAGESIDERALIQVENRGNAPCARITAVEKLLVSRNGDGSYHEVRMFHQCAVARCGPIEPGARADLGFTWDAFLRTADASSGEEAPPAIAAAPGVYDVTVRLLAQGANATAAIYETTFEIEVTA